MNEINLTSARNVTTRTGYIFASLIPLITGINIILGMKIIPEEVPAMVSAAGIIICGTILAVLGRRAVTSIGFILLGSMSLTFILGTRTSGYWPASIIDIFALLAAAIILSSKDKMKYPLAIFFILWGLSEITITLSGINSISGILPTITGLFGLYLAAASVSEKIKFPLAEYICADGMMEFNSCGTALGYIFIAFPCMYYAISCLFEIVEIDSGYYGPLLSSGPDIISGIILVYIALLLFIISKEYFHTLVFIAAGTATYIAAVITEIEPMFIIPGILLLVISLAICLNSSGNYLISAIFFILGILSVLQGSGVNNMGILFVLNLIPSLIALYMATLLFSESKLLRF